MFTLFRVMSGAQSDSESAALDSALDWFRLVHSETPANRLAQSVQNCCKHLLGIMDNIPTFKFAFVFFMVTSSWTLLSILTAVVAHSESTDVPHRR